MKLLATGGGVAAAGVGLLQHKSWGRVLAIIMSIVMLFKFPIGTAIGIYALWVLFSHVRTTKGIDEEQFLLYHLDALGKQLDAFATEGASAYLYELSEVISQER